MAFLPFFPPCLVKYSPSPKVEDFLVSEVVYWSFFLSVFRCFWFTSVSQGSPSHCKVSSSRPGDMFPSALSLQAAVCVGTSERLRSSGVFVTICYMSAKKL